MRIRKNKLLIKILQIECRFRIRSQLSELIKEKERREWGRIRCSAAEVDLFALVEESGNKTSPKETF